MADAQSARTALEVVVQADDADVRAARVALEAVVGPAVAVSLPARWGVPWK